MANEIEWSTLPAPFDKSTMTMTVLDNSSRATSIIEKGSFQVTVAWDVPLPYQCVLDGTFRIRLFAESLGNGYEGPIGGEKTVPATCGANGTPSYSSTITVNEPSKLLGEGEPDGSGVPVSGVYKLTAVLQYINTAGAELAIGGYATASVLQVRHP